MMGSMMTIALMLKAYDNMSGVVSSASNKAIASLAGIGDKMKALSGQAEQFGRSLAAEGMVISAAMTKPLTAFADLDEATIDLKASMLNNLGQVPKQFEAISKEATALGNLLPGTTADFFNAGRALVQQGTGLDTIVNGGLRSASYLAVALKLPGAEASEMVAKLREAYGLADNELMKMADLTSRASSAFGMAPQEIKIASSYSGATQNILGLKGIDNAKKLLALQGMGAGVSLEGSSWGTNFAMLLSRTAESKDRLAKNSKEMKAINADLKAYGITLEFFDKKGSFMGIDNLVRQLEKTQKMSQLDKLNLYKKLFGVEAGRPAAIIADKGWAGYQEAIKKMEQQASLQQKIDLLTQKLKVRWETFTSNLTSGLARVGEQMAVFLGPLLDRLTDFVGGPMMSWIEQHKELVGVVATGAIAVGGLLIAAGALSLVFGTGLRALVGFGGGIGTLVGWSRQAVTWLAAHRMEVLRLTGAQRVQIAVQNLQNAVAYRGGVWQALQYALMTTRYRMQALAGATRAWIVTMAGQLVGGIRGAVVAMRAWTVASLAWARTNLLTAAGLRGLAVSFAGSLLSGIKAATLAVRAFSLALLTNPIGWVVALVAGAAFLIYKNWRPISAFFAGLWQGLKAGLAPLMPAFRQLAGAAMTAFAPLMPPLRAVWGWLRNIFKQTEDTGGAARSLGVAVGQGVARAILWVGRLVKAVFTLPGKFFDAGVAIVQGLWRGIQSLASKPVEAIKSLGTSVAGAFKNLLGIRSPSRVFIGFGDNIGEGAAIGIRNSLPRVQQATRRLASIAAGFAGGTASRFGGLWQGLQAAAAPLTPAFRQLASVAMAVFFPLMPPLRAVSGWLRSIGKQTHDTGGAARGLGVAVGQGIARAALWFGRLGQAVFTLPGKFFDAGVAIMQGLWRGIQSLAGKPIEAIKAIGANVAGAFKNLLGIRSPSRVFIGFGGDIGQGAAIGIHNSTPKVQQATHRLAATTTQVADAARAPLTRAFSPGALAGMLGLGAVAAMPALANKLPPPAPRMMAPAAGVAGAAKAHVGVYGPVSSAAAPSRPAQPSVGGVVVHFSPQIHVAGGADAKGQVREALQDGYREFEANMRRFMAEQKRKGF